VLLVLVVLAVQEAQEEVGVGEAQEQQAEAEVGVGVGVGVLPQLVVEVEAGVVLPQQEAGQPGVLEAAREAAQVPGVGLV
jgi:hypothetical protein